MFSTLALLLAAGGGFFAAAIGALHSFIFTGFMVVSGTAIIVAGGTSDFLTNVAFGPVFGPHVASPAGWRPPPTPPGAATRWAARTSPSR